MKEKLSFFTILIFILSGISFGQIYVNDSSTTGDVYTSAIGNDSNAGTADAPFATITKAITSSTAGNIIYVDAGTYNENVSVSKAVSVIGANASATIIVATDGNKTPLTFATSGAAVSKFSLTHNYTTAELSAWTFNNNGVSFTSGSGNTLSDCIITLNRNGIYINSSQNNTITTNIITNNRTGINMCGTINGTIISGNTISDNWTIGIVSYANTNIANYSTVSITGNTFDGNWYSEVLIKDASTYSGTLDVSNNIFTDSPITYCTSSNSTYNEPAFADLKPVALGGTATKPATELPTLRIYNSGSVVLKYSGLKTINVESGQTIQAAINLASAGDQISIADGTYNEYLIMNKANITLTGNVSLPGNVIINAGSTGGSGSPASAIFISQPGVALKGFTLNGGGQSTSTAPRYGIYISGSTASDAVFENVVVQQFSRTGFNFNGAQDITINNVSSLNNGGAGLFFLDVNNAALSNITTNNNLWGGVGISTWGRYYTGGVEGIVFSGTNSFGESTGMQGGIYLEEGNYNDKANPYLISYSDNASDNANVTFLTNDFKYALGGLQNDGDPITSDGYKRLRFYDTEAHVLNAAAAAYEATFTTCPGHLLDDGRFVKNLTTTNIEVSAGLEVQDAIDGAEDGDEIFIDSGTFSAFQVDKPITLVGNGTVINHGSPAIIVNSTGVSISGFVFNYDAADYAIDVLAGAYDVNIHSCDFTNVDGANIGNGIRNQGTGTVNATLNFWNSVTGPTIASNPSGVGNSALNASTGYLFYTPWYGDASHSTEVGGTTLVSPINMITDVTILPTLTWNPLGTPTPHTLRISTHADMSLSTILYTGTASTYTVTEAQALDNNTTYYWQVTDNGGGNSPIWSFTTAPKVNVVLSFPNNEQLDVDFNSVYFSFYPYSNSFTYNIQCIGDPGHTLTPTDWVTPFYSVDVTNLYSLPVNASGFLPNKTYYWRIVVKNASNEIITYSTVSSFTTKKGSYAPYLSYPIGGVQLLTSTPTLYWYIGTYDLTGLTFDISITDGTTTYNYADQTGLSFTVPSGVLTSGVNYTWTVSCKYNGADAQTSSSATFQILNNSATVQPYLAYPTGDVTVYSTTPILYWYLGQYATGLNFDIFWGEEGNPTANTINTTDFYYQIPTASALEAGKTYEWYVVANGASSSLSSAHGKFTVASYLAYGSPIASWPVGNPTYNTDSPILYWFVNGSTSGVSGYQVYYSDALSAEPDWSGITATTAIADPVQMYLELSSMAVGTHYWAVRAIYNTTPVTYSDWYHTNTEFTIDSTASLIGVPYVAAPTGGLTISSTAITLYWYVIGDATNIDAYKLEWTKTSDWSVIESKDGVVGQSYEITGLTPGATYWWRVSATTDGGLSYGTASNPVGRFVIAPEVSSSIVPLAGSPINDVSITNAAATLSWFTPTFAQTQLKYNLEYSTNADFSNVKVVNDIQEQAFNLQGLENNTTYYWRVSSKTETGDVSDYSNTGSFKYVKSSVTSVEAENTIPVEFDLSQNYPNPFNPTTRIAYSLPENSFVTLKIYDMLGREVKTLVNQDMKAGKITVDWNSDDNSGRKVASGVYIYRITAGNFVSSKKMMLIK